MNGSDRMHGVADGLMPPENLTGSDSDDATHAQTRWPGGLTADELARSLADLMMKVSAVVQLGNKKNKRSGQDTEDGCAIVRLSKRIGAFVPHTGPSRHRKQPISVIRNRRLPIVMPCSVIPTLPR